MNKRFAAPFFQPATLFALATFVLIVVRATRTVDPYWDTLAYHWPYAARIAGLCDKDCFLLSLGIEARYDGFPLLLTAIQGWLWRLTGTPALADLINIAMVVALSVYLRYRFAVPLAWSWLAFLAIPQVQIQLTSTYIDVPVNAAVTLALMVVLRILIEPDADQRIDVALALAALAIAAGSKYQMVPIAIATWGVVVVLATWKPSIIHADRRYAAFAILSVAGALVLLPKLAINAFAFANPFYPIDTHLGPIHFSGLEDMRPTNSISDAWTDFPRSLRWLASVFEFDAFRGRILPWTLGQGDVLQSSPSFRMGGYFVPYVLGAIAIVWWGARSSTRAKWVAAMLIVLSVICASLPLSHELRYYMFWMLSLVSCVLIVVHSPALANPQQRVQRNVAHALVAIAVVSVITMTGGVYLQTGGQTLHELLRGTDSVVAQVPEGGTLCVRNRHPRAFLYSSLFHPSRHYHTRSLFADEQVDCSLRLDLDRQSVTN
jgi:hypothetical protein